MTPDEREALIEWGIIDDDILEKISRRIHPTWWQHYDENWFAFPRQAKHNFFNEERRNIKLIIEELARQSPMHITDEAVNRAWRMYWACDGVKPTHGEAERWKMVLEDFAKSSGGGRPADTTSEPGGATLDPATLTYSNRWGVKVETTVLASDPTWPSDEAVERAKDIVRRHSTHPYLETKEGDGSDEPAEGSDFCTYLTFDGRDALVAEIAALAAAPPPDEVARLREALGEYDAECAKCPVRNQTNKAVACRECGATARQGCCKDDAASYRFIEAARQALARND